MIWKKWDKDKEELLVKLWRQGLNKREIASAMGDGITKNMVIGKLHRLGLNNKKKPYKKPRKEPEYKKTKLPIDGRGLANTALGKPCGLADLAHNQCHWPVGHPKENGFHFCGAYKQGASPYCAEHKRLAYPSAK